MAGKKVPKMKFLFKFCVVGESAVGKSMILDRYRGLEFRNEHQATIGVDFSTKDIIIKTDKDEHQAALQLWDTAGEERYRSISSVYFKGAHGVLLIYDVSNEQSFDALSKWLETIRNVAPESKVLLIGNKSDLFHAVSTEQGEMFAQSHQLKFMETSAFSGQNIDKAFESLTRDLIMDQIGQNSGQQKEFAMQNVVKTNTEIEPKKGCC